MGRARKQQSRNAFRIPVYAAVELSVIRPRLLLRYKPNKQRTLLENTQG